MLSNNGQSKKPIAYYFLNSTLDAIKAKEIIIQVIKKLKEIGLTVIALSTDMGDNFGQLASLLGVSTNSPYFFVNGKKVFYIYDPPHVQKACKNNFSDDIIIGDTKIMSPFFINF